MDKQKIGQQRQKIQHLQGKIANCKRGIKKVIEELQRIDNYLKEYPEDKI